MRKFLAAAVLLLAAPAWATTITNLALTAQSGTGATIQWTTNVPATTQLFYGVGGPTNSTPINRTLVTSHTVALQGVVNGATYSYYASSTDVGNNNAISPVQVFTVCTAGAGLTNVNGTINNYYEYGDYTFSWVTPSGYSIQPTVCGQPLTTTSTGNLDQGASFNQQIADSNQIVPSPSQWRLTVTGIDGSIGSFNVTQPVTPQGNNLTQALQLAAVGNLIHVWYDPNTATFYPPTGGGGGGVSSFAAPSVSWPSWLVPTVTNATTTPSLAVAASPIPNVALANSATTVNGQVCTLGSSCTVGPTGTGTTGFLPIWSSASVLGSSSIDENQTNANQATVGDTLGVNSLGGLTLGSNLTSGTYSGAYFSGSATNTFGALSSAGTNIYNYVGSSTKLCSIPVNPGTQFTNVLASTSCSFEFNGGTLSLLPSGQATSGTPGIGSAGMRLVSMGFNKGITVVNPITGTGYSGTGTCTVTGGTFTVQATCIGLISATSPFPLQIIITNPGIYTVVPTNFTLSGWTFTTTNTATPALAGAGAGASQNGTWSVGSGVQSTSPFSPTYTISAPLQPPTSGPATVIFTGGSNGGYNFQMDAATNTGGVGAIFTESALTGMRTYTLPNTAGTFMVSLTTTGTTGVATFSAGVLNIPNYAAGASGVSSINTVTGAFTFNGAGVTCVTTTCTFSGSGAPAFNTVTAGTNTAALLVGTGGSLGVTGSGTIAATSVPASGLTGSTLASGVTASSLTSLGTIATGGWQGTPVGAQWGGTGINTSASTGCPSIATGTWSVVACGTGTVTSVGWTGGIVSVATATTTPAFTIAGTSGGIPYFSSGTTWASSAAGTANALMKWGGAGVAPSASALSDNGTTVTSTEQVAVNVTGAASQINFTPSGTSPATVAGSASLGVPNTVTTAGVYLLPAAPGSGVYTGTNAAGIVTTTFTPLNGAGAGIPTGPTSSTNNDAAIFTGTAGQIADSGGPMPATIAAVSHQFLTSYTKSSGVFTLAQPTLADIGAGATSTGTFDFSGATQIKLPVAAAYVSAANGEIGYDTTNLNWHIWDNAADNFLAVFPVASPPTTGNCAKFVKTSNTWTLADAGTTCGGGGSLPTGTTGQGLYYAAGGTTVTATSDIIHTGATAGSPVGIGNTAPIAVLDVIGNENHLPTGPATNTTSNGTCASSATSCVFTSLTGYPTSGYGAFFNNQFVGEVLSWTGITGGTTLTGMTRSLCNTTAPATRNTGATFVLISNLVTDSLTAACRQATIFNGATLNFPTSNEWGSTSPPGTNAIINQNPTTFHGAITIDAAFNSSSSVKYATLLTNTACAAVGTSASPSLVACAAAPAGAFSCATTASAATCVVSDTAVTANSVIIVTEVADEGTVLGVTCNTAPTVTPAILLASKTTSTGFTINMPTITVNPACFDYTITN